VRQPPYFPEVYEYLIYCCARVPSFLKDMKSTQYLVSSWFNESKFTKMNPNNFIYMWSYLERKRATPPPFPL